MKKLTSFIIIYFILLSLSVVCSEAASLKVNINGTIQDYNGSTYTLKINNKAIQLYAPLLGINSSTYVSARELYCNVLNGELIWNDNTQTAKLDIAGQSFIFKNGIQKATFNGKEYDMGAPALIVNNRFMVPIRFVSESLGFVVKYDANTGVVSLNSSEATEIKKTIAGDISSITYMNTAQGEYVNLKTTSGKLGKHFLLPPNADNPNYRICLYINDTIVTNLGTFDVKSGNVLQVRYAQYDFENKTSSVVIETPKKPDYSLSKVSDAISVRIGNSVVGNSMISGSSINYSYVPENGNFFAYTEQTSTSVKNTATDSSGSTNNPSSSTGSSSTNSSGNISSTETQNTNNLNNYSSSSQANTLDASQVKYSNVGGKETVTIYGIDINKIYSQNPSKVEAVFDSANNIFNIRITGLTDKLKTQIIPINSTNIKGVLISDIKSPNINTIKLLTKNNVKLRIDSDGSNNTVISIEKALNKGELLFNGKSQTFTTLSYSSTANGTGQNTTANSNGSTGSTTATTPPSNNNTNPTTGSSGTISNNTNTSSTSVNRGDYDRNGVVHKGALNISNVGKKILIDLDKYEGYNIFRVSDPERIVIDIPNLVIESNTQTIMVNNSYINQIRYSQYDSNVVRLVIDVNGVYNWTATEYKGSLQIELVDTFFNGIQYHNSDSKNIYFEVKAPELAKKYIENKESFKVSFSSQYMRYSINFPYKYTNIGYGNLSVNDELLSDIKIYCNETIGMSVLNFYSKYNLEATINVGSDDDTIIINLKATSTRETPITKPTPTPKPVVPISTPTYKYKQLIVIDAGHGGRDPGAVVGNVYESDVVLDICLRLNEILKSKGIKTLMTRTTDDFIGLQERADMANNAKADLFLSVHVNSMPDPNFAGTMSLYYPTSYSGKRFSEILQKNLTSMLGTQDRGIISRPNLVVLNSTSMTAVLAEIACLSNSEEKKKLLTSDFRQKAAQALADSVIEMFEKMN